MLKPELAVAVYWVIPARLPTIVSEPVTFKLAEASPKYNHILFSLKGIAPDVEIVKDIV